MKLTLLLPFGRCDASQKVGIAYMDGAGGVPSVRRTGKWREQERKLEGSFITFAPSPLPFYALGYSLEGEGVQ